MKVHSNAVNPSMPRSSPASSVNRRTYAIGLRQLLRAAAVLDDRPVRAQAQHDGEVRARDRFARGCGCRGCGAGGSSRYIGGSHAGCSFLLELQHLDVVLAAPSSPGGTCSSAPRAGNGDQVRALVAALRHLQDQRLVRGRDGRDLGPRADRRAETSRWSSSGSPAPPARPLVGGDRVNDCAAGEVQVANAALARHQRPRARERAMHSICTRSHRLMPASLARKPTAPPALPDSRRGLVFVLVAVRFLSCVLTLLLLRALASSRSCSPRCPSPERRAPSSSATAEDAVGDERSDDSQGDERDGRRPRPRRPRCRCTRRRTACRRRRAARAPCRGRRSSRRRSVPSANRPSARIPHAPHTPCTDDAPTGSSILQHGLDEQRRIDHQHAGHRADQDRRRRGHERARRGDRHHARQHAVAQPARRRACRSGASSTDRPRTRRSPRPAWC